MSHIDQIREWIKERRRIANRPEYVGHIEDDALCNDDTKLALIERLLEAVESATESNSEAINGLVRGFVGNAKSDMRHSQVILRSVIKDCAAILTKETK